MKLGLFFFPLIFAILIVLLKWKHPGFYKRFVWEEDSVVEYLTPIFYLFSCLISYSISVSFHKNKFKLISIPYFILTVCFFFIAMEEISWGQRLLSIKTPELILKYNYQGEMNLHNIKSFPLHMLFIIVGLYGALARYLIPKKIVKKFRAVVNYFTPEYYLVFYFLIVGILYLYYEYLSSFIVLILGDKFGWGPGHFIHGKDQEPAEFLLSIGFFLFVLINKYRQIWYKDSIFWNIRRSPSNLS